MKLFTIGFTQKSAERFFALLQAGGVKTVIDTRLNNRSQLSGFSKGEDLPFLLRAVAGIGYRHAIEMAPTQGMLDRYKKRKGAWSDYEAEFMTLIKSRDLVSNVSIEELSNACLLCSEHKPDHCHRRLVAQYLNAYFPQIEIVHLM